jgi:hypothetical protein
MDEILRSETINFFNNHPDNSISFQTNNLGDLQGVQTSDGGIISPNQAITGVGVAGRLLPMKISMAVGDGADLQRSTFTMLIAPETWNEGKTNAFQHEYTRKGWVIQLWGPNQDTISSTGKTGSFMTSSGLDYYRRHQSLGFLNFLAFVSAYRNNGYTFMDPMNTTSLSRVISTVHGVEISFDNSTLLGHFNNFTIDEDDEHPYLFNYNFEFIAGVLSGTTNEVRGHFLPIPTGNSVPTNTSPPLVNNTSRSINLSPVAPDLSSTSVTTVPLQAQDNSVVRSIWEQKTGLSWSSATSFTDGSAAGNAKLLQLLLSGQWNSITEDFS